MNREQVLKEMYDKYGFDYVGDFGLDLEIEENALKQAYEFRKELERKRLISLQNSLGTLTGQEFEELCANLFRQIGYDVKITKGSGDRGADLIIEKGVVNYAVQCKCFANPVGNKAIQEAYSAKGIYHTVNAAVLTNSVFTKQAKEDAKSLNVLLWDFEVLANLLEGADPLE